MNDNRRYYYPENSVSKRDEYEIIINWVDVKSRIIDLGCGDGSLLKLLKDIKNVEGIGIEISETGCKAARKKGLKVVQDRIDVPLKYNNQEFDFAICNVTVQMVMYPEVLLLEMKRIAKRQIISFPNFAYIQNRVELLLNGRMPQFMIPGYKWHSTGHIHQLSLKDFRDFCKDNKILILKENHIYPKKLYNISLPKYILNRFPNLFTSIAIYLLKNNED